MYIGENLPSWILIGRVKSLRFTRTYKYSQWVFRAQKYQRDNIGFAIK